MSLNLIYIVESAGITVIVSKRRIISSNLRNLGFHMYDPTNIWQASK